MKWDVFISHASEDKFSVAQPLAEMLEKLGFSVWLDENELTLGDSLVNKINEGISNSRFGLVILSKDFLKKDWPQKELNSFIAIETQQKKLILPIWHKVNKTHIAKYSPLLADKFSISTDAGILELAYEVSKVINREKNINIDSIEKNDNKKKIKPEAFLIDKQKNIFFTQMALSFLFLAISFIIFGVLVVLSEDKNISMQDTYIRRLTTYSMILSLYIVIVRLVSYISINISYKKGMYSKVDNPKHIIFQYPTYYILLSSKLRIVAKYILIIFWSFIILGCFYTLPNLILFVYNKDPFALDFTLIISLISYFSFLKIKNILKINSYVINRKLTS